MKGGLPFRSMGILIVAGGGETGEAKAWSPEFVILIETPVPQRGAWAFCYSSDRSSW